MWHHKNKSIESMEDLPDWECLHGFIYKITCIQKDNFQKFYIGKKNFNTKRKKKLLKNEIPTDKRLKTYKHVVKESNWKSYFGSNTELVADVKKFGPSNFKREIIALAFSPKELTYLEYEQQFLNDVLRSSKCYNDNIAGKFFKKDLKQN